MKLCFLIIVLTLFVHTAQSELFISLCLPEFIMLIQTNVPCTEGRDLYLLCICTKNFLSDFKTKPLSRSSSLISLTSNSFFSFSPSLHTCLDKSSGKAPEPTAVARTTHSQTSSGSETQVTGRRPLSRSLMSHTPQGMTGGGLTQCSRSLHTVFLQAACTECSVQLLADLQDHLTAAV